MSNLVSNSRFAGASVGVAGSGGVLPSNWQSLDAATYEVISTSPVDGMAVWRLRIALANGSGATRFPGVRILSPVAAAQPYAFQNTTRIVTATAVTPYFEWVSTDSALNYLQWHGGANLTTSQTPYSGTATSHASATQMWLFVGYQVPNGTTIDGAFELSTPMLETGSTVHAFEPTPPWAGPVLARPLNPNLLR